MFLDGLMIFLNLPRFETMDHSLLPENPDGAESALEVPSVHILKNQKDQTTWIPCPSCEAPCRDRVLSKGTELRCRRCGARVKIARGEYSLQPALAFSTAALFAAILANLNPILTFDVVGDTQSGWIITGVESLNGQGYWPLALLVFFASILAPLLYLSAMWYASAACFLRVPLPFARTALQWVEMMEPWNLVPVYAIATVVSVVKLRMLGNVEWQSGARWVLGMAFFSLLAANAFDCKLVGEKLTSLEAGRK